MKLEKLVLAAFLCFSVSACATKVERVERDKMIDISGSWNDYDAMIVSQEFVNSALKSPWLDAFTQQNSRNPIVIVGHIANRSSEHINTQVFVKYLERELMNSGKVIFVASPTEREGIREERGDMQQGYTDPETIKAMGREKGADFMFIGSVNSVEDTEKNRSAVLYQANMELIDLETNVKVWLGQKEIKKVVTKPRFTL
jgi:uncharacterized protein (TIGR02722 family)